jgi:hypothetical protein
VPKRNEAAGTVAALHEVKVEDLRSQLAATRDATPQRRREPHGRNGLRVVLGSYSDDFRPGVVVDGGGDGMDKRRFAVFVVDVERPQPSLY